MPVSRLIFPALSSIFPCKSLRERGTLGFAANRRKAAAAMDRGKSLFITSLSTGTVCMTAQMPSTHRRLKILEPTTLLSAISLEPQRAAEVLTANSGALVPKATMVSPMISPGTLKFLARAELPSTKRSAPFIKAANPITSNNTLNKNILLHSPFFKI